MPRTRKTAVNLPLTKTRKASKDVGHAVASKLFPEASLDDLANLSRAAQFCASRGMSHEDIATTLNVTRDQVDELAKVATVLAA